MSRATDDAKKRTNSAGALAASTASATKPSDELVDVFVFRPLAALVVRAVLPLRFVTPNQITLTSVLFGWIACVGFARATPLGLVTASLAALIAMVFDCADGQLARARGGGSTAGRILDGLADYMVAFAVHLGALFCLYRGNFYIGHHLLTHPEIFAIMLAAGTSMAVQCALYDFYKHRYLGYLGRDYRMTLETPEALRDEIERATSAFDRGLLSILHFYLWAQERIMPRKHVEEATRHVAPDAAERYLRTQEPLLRAWSMLGPSGHHVLLALAGVLTIFRADFFILYAVFTLTVQNAYAIVLLVVQGRSTRDFETQSATQVLRR